MKKYLVFLLMIAGSTAYAGVVKWVDAEGKVHYSEKAPEGSTASSVATSGGSSNSSEWAASGFAKLDDESAVPYLSEGGRARYKEFLSHAGPRAFVVCLNGSFSTIYGEKEIGMEKALKNKLANSQSSGCKPYVVNNAVVWSGN
jgi:hypothetical protein